VTDTVTVKKKKCKLSFWAMLYKSLFIENHSIFLNAIPNAFDLTLIIS